MKSGLILFLGLLSMANPVHVSNSFHLIVHARSPALHFYSARMGSAAGPGHTGIRSFSTLSLEGRAGRSVHHPAWSAHSVWVNTLFDPAEGRMQYVSLIPERLVSTWTFN